jgi:hypothetical protein
MRFDVSIAHEALCTRVGVIGEPSLGRLLSLLQVLEVDSATWPREAVLLDLRGLRKPLSHEELSRLATEAARALRRMKRIAVLASDGGPREIAGVRLFADAQAALRWVGGNS